MKHFTNLIKSSKSDHVLNKQKKLPFAMIQNNNESKLTLYVKCLWILYIWYVKHKCGLCALIFHLKIYNKYN
jgi:hypothetical protein